MHMKFKDSQAKQWRYEVIIRGDGIDLGSLIWLVITWVSTYENIN